MNVTERFMAKVDQTTRCDGCWQWTAFQSRGYGRFHWDGEVMAYRVAYRLFKGQIPPELEIDHLCRNRACVNPSHLRAITHAENTRLAKAGKDGPQTHCPQNHAYDEENTQYRRTPTGVARVCRACQHDYYVRRSHREVGSAL